MDILISVIAKMAEYTVKPIGRQLGYVYYYNNNISDLSDEVKKLKQTRDSVQHRVDEAERNAQVTEEVVKEWFNEADRIINSYEELIPGNEVQENKKYCSTGLCFNLVQRHRESRKAKKMTVEVSKIKTNGNFESVAHQVPLSNVKLEVSGFMSFGSRESIITEIMDYLMDDNVNMIGVYGMGGTGKTMLAKEIIRRVMENKSFDEAAMSTVSQTHDFKRIQGELGDILGLKFEQETVEGRARKLHMRLKNEKKILIVLDDIWKDIDLDQIGIPREDNKGCKILFTSRDKNTLTSMGAKKTFDVQVLKEEESWELFNQMVGGVVVGSDEEQTAVKIVEECAHLPIIITIIAKALRGKQLRIWKDALRELGRPVAMNLNNKEINERVYTSLKLSYQYLGSRSEAQSVFLLCSMFPEDHRINVEDLHVYAMSMGLLMDIKTLAEGRDRTLKLVDDLKSSSLLQETEYGDGYVKMHDIVRDVAILIASEDDRIRTLSYVHGLNEWQEEKISGNYTAAYLHFRNSPNPPQKLILPSIQLLMVTGLYGDKPEISGTFSEEMKDLKVLELERMRISLSSPSLHSFANLRSLRLLYCELKDVDMSSVELNKLEILSFRGSNIIEIPMVISQSMHLKLLDLSFCEELEVIPPDLLSNLTKLEELFLGSFVGWEEESLNRERKNASLCEIKHLSRLSALSICIPNEKIVPRQLISSKLNLEYFDISIGSGKYLSKYYPMASKKSRLHIKSESPLDDQIKMLFKTVGELKLKGHIAENFLRFEFEFDKIQFSHLNNLCLGDMKEVNHVIRESKKAFWKILTNLESIEITYCMMLEVVFVHDIEEATNKLELIHLKSLSLESLPGLISFSSKIEQLNNSKKVGTLFNNQVSLPNLETLTIKCVKNLKRICDKVLIPGSSFAKLRKLEIEGCDNLEIVFPSNMMSILNCLEYLRIWDCKSLKGIFEESNIATEQCRESLLPRLSNLSLYKLPNLKYVWSEDPWELQSFENVERISIEECPKLIKRVYPLKVVQRLHELEMEYGELMGTLEKVETHSHQGEILELCDGEVLLPKLETLKLWGSLNYKRTRFPKQLVRIFLNLTVLEVREIFVDEIFPIAQMPSLRNLSKLIIHKCNGLTHLLNPQLAATLVKLYWLELSGCKMMTSVISQGSTDEEEEIVFTELERLVLDDLPRLTSFHSGECIIGFACLKHVRIENCPEMKVFSLGTATAPCLTKRSVYWSKSLGIEYGELIEALNDPCESSEKTEIVELRDDPDLLPKLEYLTLSGSILNYKWTHFPMEIVPILHTLKDLEVRELFVEEIFPNCPNAQSHPLERLELYKLPKLKYLWKENSQMNTSLMLPNLDYLKIEECGRLNSIVPSSSSVSSLRNLRWLIIHKCHGLTHLLNPHMATTLVLLQYMKLSQCKMMTTVIAQGSGVEEEIVFPELKYLVNC